MDLYFYEFHPLTVSPEVIGEGGCLVLSKHTLTSPGTLSTLRLLLSKTIPASSCHNLGQNADGKEELSCLGYFLLSKISLSSVLLMFLLQAE